MGVRHLYPHDYFTDIRLTDNFSDSPGHLFYRGHYCLVVIILQIPDKLNLFLGITRYGRALQISTPNQNQNPNHHHPSNQPQVVTNQNR